jgi:3-hydroxyisobutyrate dehydrogenase-like beta-hydroxyacid dehydrogenase
MAATGEAMALALRPGVDIDLLIKAVAAGTAARPVRHPRADDGAGAISAAMGMRSPSRITSNC